MKDWKKIVVSPKDSIRTAMEAIDTMGAQIALVVNGEGKLVGTVSDGDIRRSILRGVDLSATVVKVMNHHPISLPINTPQKEILSVMQQHVIQDMPLIDAEGILQDFYSIKDLLSVPHLENWVVIMAGGMGKRLRPLTNTCPKPMLPINGKPLLETLLENFIQQGFSRFFFAVNYKADLIKDHFQDGKSWQVSIEYLHESQPLGTGGALSLLPKPSLPFIVANGDLLTKLNFQRFLEFHNESQGIATMGVRDYDYQIPYGVIQVENHHITAIQEKPIHHCYVNTGAYVLNPECLQWIPSNEAYPITNLFEELIIQGYSVNSFPIREYWLDVGQWSDFEKAQIDFDHFFDN